MRPRLPYPHFLRLFAIAAILSLLASTDLWSCGWSRLTGLRYSRYIKKLDDVAILPRPKRERLFIERHVHDYDPYENRDLRQQGTGSTTKTGLSAITEMVFEEINKDLNTQNNPQNSTTKADTANSVAASADQTGQTAQTANQPINSATNSVINPTDNQTNNQTNNQTTNVPTAKPLSKDLLLYQQAQQLEQAGNYAVARQAYTEAYYSGAFLTKPQPDKASENYFTDPAIYRQTNALIERIYLFSDPTNYQEAAPLTDYLLARQEYETGNYQKARQRLSSHKTTTALADDTVFLLGACAYQEKDYINAIAYFENLVQQYPQSNRRGLAEFMLGKTHYKLAANYTAFPDYRYSESPEFQESQKAEFQERQKATKPDLDKALEHFQAAIKAEPKGLLTPDYYDWLASTYYRLDQPLKSLENYVAAFQREQRHPDRLLYETSFAYGIIRKDQETEAIKLVSADPQLLVSYLWYGVYHHIDAPERQLQIAQSALPYLKKYDRHMLAPSLAVRLAQAFYNGENYSEAAKMAALAINDPQTAAEALWMRGVAYAKSKNYPLAIKDFEKLLANYPQSSFIVNAQQELGVIYEQNGQIVEAAALYLSTNHLSDARYVMDILLSPDQLIQLRQHPRLTLAGRDEVSFALASKYMLTLALDKAAIEFRQIKAPAKPQNAQIDQDYYLDIENAAAVHDLGTERDRMLQVINELQPRLAAVDTAKSYAEKAQALYQVGAYIYHKNNKNHNRHAIFNNALMSYWDSPYYAYLHIHPDERQLRQRRFLQANLLLRAEEYFRIVALQYPQSTVAAKALYSAALCNTWYPDYHPAVFDYQDNQASTARINAAEAQAIEYLQLLIKRYPDHSLVPEAKGLLSVLAVNREDRYRRLYFENNSETPSQNSDSPDNQDE